MLMGLNPSRVTIKCEIPQSLRLWESFFGGRAACQFRCFAITAISKIAQNYRSRVPRAVVFYLFRRFISASTVA